MKAGDEGWVVNLTGCGALYDSLNGRPARIVRLVAPGDQMMGYSNDGRRKWFTIRVHCLEVEVEGAPWPTMAVYKHNFKPKRPPSGEQSVLDMFKEPKHETV